MSIESFNSSKESNLVLPNVLVPSINHVNSIMSAFNLPREVLSSDCEIAHAWRELPREIERIPLELRDEFVVRMCVATSVGLFDAAINYIWNAVVTALRQKVRNFGFALVAQTLNKSFEEKNLNDYRDAQLLDLCYKLELLTEDGYFFLDQCREVRNNFSTAHPSMARIDDRELINFISRCCKYGITEDSFLKGIDTSDFLSSIKSRKLGNSELKYWVDKLITTFPARRQILIPMLMGIYCDPSSPESARINCLKISLEIADMIDDKSKSALIEQYHQYYIKGKNEKQKAARQYFERMHLLGLLDTSEQHSIVKKACQNLLFAHQGFNNFHNEPPFAERLHDITRSFKVPETVQNEFVYCVLMGYVGNRYGVSNAAIPYYEEMIVNFSPKEINHLIHLMDMRTPFSEKVRMYRNCKERFVIALELIDRESMNATQIAQYDLTLAKLKQ